MATYATADDFEDYTDNSVILDADATEMLLRKAEKDVNRILPRGSYLTGAIIGISLDSSVTDGDFTLGMNWRGVDYTSEPILHDDIVSEVVTMLQDSVDQYGNNLPPGVWSIPDTREYNQAWAAGPLPGVPVVVQAINSMGRQDIGDLSIVANNLVPTGTTITVDTIVRGGLRVNPYQLPADYADALRDATCAQAEYRNTMGEDFFVRAQFTSVSGPEFRTQGRLPVIGPKVMQELQGTDLVQRGARARPGTATRRQIVYSPIGTTPIPDDWRAI